MNKLPGLPLVQIIGFSGQRQARNPAAVATALREQLKKLQADRSRALALCSLDGDLRLVFAREALALGFPLELLLPAPREEFTAAFSGPVREELDRVLEKAAKITIVSASSRNQGAINAAQKLVEDADILLVVGDDNADDETAEVIAYATHRGSPMIRLQENSHGVEVRDLGAAEGSSGPSLDIDVLEKMVGVPPPEPPIPEELLQFFRACDAEATRMAPQVRRSVLNIVLANAVASVSGAVGSSFPHSAGIGTLLTVIKFSCVLLGLVIFAVLRHRQSQNHWLTLRLQAEVCRSAMATWTFPQPIEPLSVHDAPELRGLIQNLRYFRATRRDTASPSVESFKADYGLRRLLDQYRYFQRQAGQAVRLSGRLTPLYWLASGLALAVSGAALLFPMIFGHHAPGTWTNLVFVLVPIVAPALASWILAWQAIESVGRKRFRLGEMERQMHQAFIDLVHCRSWDTAHQVVLRAEKLLLNEVLEWYAFVKYSK